MGWQYHRVPSSQYKFPFLLDSDNINDFGQSDYYIPDRLERQRYKDTSDKKSQTVMDVLKPLTGINSSDVVRYDKSMELSKEIMNGAWTTFGRNRVFKKSSFEVTDPIQIRNDRIVFPNQYTWNPLFAEASSDAPAYHREMRCPVEVDAESLYKFGNDLINFRM